MSEYKLSTLRVELKTYGELKGQYVGTVKFENDESESFTFNLTPERTQEYLKLISEEVIKTATELGGNLANSMGIEPLKEMLV